QAQVPGFLHRSVLGIARADPHLRRFARLVKGLVRLQGDKGVLTRSADFELLADTAPGRIASSQLNAVEVVVTGGRIGLEREIDLTSCVCAQGMAGNGCRCLIEG